MSSQHGGPAAKCFQLAVVAVIAVSALVAASTGRPPGRDRRAPIALTTLVVSTVAGSLLTSSQWLPRFGRPGYLKRAVAAGAVGFPVKDGPVERLAEAIRRELPADRSTGWSTPTVPWTG